ncbi:MAG: hydantoinase B/oxoprolinase family protein [Acidimicrobiia bacterium]
MEQPDPITLGVVWGAFHSIAVEIGTSLHRAAYSPQVREGQDFSVAIFDERGQMVVQGPYTPGHLGAMNFAVLNAIDAYPVESLQPGDAILLNDPALGSGHLPDFFLTQPVFYNGEVVAFLTNLVHQTDVGGSRPGSQAVEGIFDYHQEGLFIPPIKLVDGGREVEGVWKLVLANSRTPGSLLGDLRAQRNSLLVGQRRVIELFEQHGLETVRTCMAAIMDASEARMRERIREIPNGAYSFTDYMDDCGPGTPPIKMQATVTVTDDAIDIDWTGTDSQTESGLNSYINYTRSYTYMAVKCLTDPHGPMSGGALRAVTVSAPEGSFVNPRRPAGGGPRAVCCHRIFEVVIGALSQAVPEEVQAACSHMANPTYGGIDRRSGRRFVGYELVFGGTGARAGRDGCEAMSSPFNASNIPVESIEVDQPVVIERFEFIPDSGGAGKFRGGSGLRRDVRILADAVRFTNLSDRNVVASYGLFGGNTGSLGATVVNPETDTERLVGSKASFDLEYGDVVSIRLAGGGGYGDPLDRDPGRVARDVELGFVTPVAASQRYGVAVQVMPDHVVVDADETTRLREAARHD